MQCSLLDSEREHICSQKPPCDPKSFHLTPTSASHAQSLSAARPQGPYHAEPTSGFPARTLTAFGPVTQPGCSHVAGLWGETLNKTHPVFRELRQWRSFKPRAHLVPAVGVCREMGGNSGSSGACVSALYLPSPARFHAHTHTHTHTTTRTQFSCTLYRLTRTETPHVYMYTPYTLIPPPQLPHIHTTPPILLYTQCAHRTHPHPSKPTMSHSHSCVLIPSKEISTVTVWP